MTRSRSAKKTLGRGPALYIVFAVLLVALGWLLVAVAPDLATSSATAPDGNGTAARSDGGGDPERKINATLFFVSEDGLALVGVQREVPFGDPIAEQARHIVEAQLGAPTAPLGRAIPEGTKLRSVFVSDRSEAFVDLSGDVSAKHTGGSLDELLTVYAVVNAVAVNLPAITRVQILIDGKEADTLAGHVDLRHPLQKGLAWVRTEKDAS